MAGNINAGKVFVELQLKYSKFVADTKQFLSSMGTGFTSAFSKVDAGFTKFTNGLSKTFSIGRMVVAGGIAATLGMVAKKVIDTGDKIADNSRKLTMNAEAFQFFDYAAGKSGTTIETVGVGVKSMTNLLDDAKTKGSAGAKALEALGLSLKDFEGLTTDQKLEKFASTIAAIPEPANRATAAMSIFGSRAGMELLPMIEDLDKLKEDFANLNTMMSNEAVAAADKFNDQMLNLETTLVNMVANSGLVAWLANVAEGMNGIVGIGNKLGEKTGIGAPGSAGYRGGASGLLSNYVDAASEGSGWNPLNWAGKAAHAMGAGEQDGMQVYTVDTEADKKKLADAKKANIESGGKTLVERKAEKDLADTKAREDRKQKEKDAQSAGVLSDMEKEAELQELINAGKERQAAIERVLYAQRKSLGRELTEAETAKFTTAAGKLYDTEEAGKKTKEEKDPALKLKEQLRQQNLLNAKKDRQAAIEEALSAAGNKISVEKIAEISDLAGRLYDSRNAMKKEKFEAAGSFYGNQLSLQAGGASERTAKATETIVKNTKETNQLLKTGTMAFG